MDEFAGNRWAEDFSWIEGTLRFVELEGGFYEVEFGDEHAPYGGRLVLGRPAELADIPAGSHITVRGHVDEMAMSIFMAGPMYTLASVQRHD